INFALMIASIGIAIYMVEGLFIFSDFMEQMKLPRDFDRRTRLDVLSDLRKTGVDAVTNPPTHTFLLERKGGKLVSAFQSGGREFLPLSGMAHRTSVVCNEDGRYLIMQTDQYGFNNPPEVWNLPRISIAAVGDSFTHGDCVDSSESYMARIRKYYPA